MRLGLLLALLCSAKSNTFSENDIPELVYMDKSINPCDNFYQFTCGNFKNIHPRPSTVNIIDQFTLLEEELIQIGKEILSTPKQKDDPLALKKAKAAYMGCVHDFFRNSIAVPELKTINEFGGLPIISSSNKSVEFSWNEIGDLVGKYGVPLIFTYNIVQTNQNETLIMLNPDTLTNPSLFRPNHHKSYEEVLEEDFRKIGRKRFTRDTIKPAAFDVFLQTLAKNLLRYTNPNKSDDDVLAELDDMANFMRSMYAGGIKDGEVLPLEFPPTLEQLQNWTNAQFGKEIINWIAYLNKIFQFAGVEVTQSTKLYHQGLNELYGVLNLVLQTDPKIVKNFALFRVFLFQAPDSDYLTRKAFEDYYTAKGYQLYPRWEYCTRKILDVVDTASLSYAVTYAYERYHYNTNKIPQAAEMINNIRNVFEENLATSDWMDDESRDAALKKAKNMLVLLAYPDFVTNTTQLNQFYENFQICQWDNYGNARSIRAFKQAYQFTQLGTPDREFWGKSTFDPNAYYNRPNNKIVIPIAMLNPVFFYGDNPIIDYSRLGSIIGHEITHGFDQNGKNYNEDGLQIPWWTDQTMENFLDRTQCFIKQYSNYYVTEVDTYVNGSYCINENLADNGGVREAFKAFKKVITEQNIQVSGNYTAEQLFFIGYATMWCTDESDYYLNVLTATSNGYPPNRFRVIGSLSNMAEFSDAFNCPVGSEMNPESKCVLW